MALSSRKNIPLSKETIVAEAIAILDASDTKGLTFRALAGRMNTGAGALYHYFTNKEELLSVATGTVIEECLREQKSYNDPGFALTEIARALWNVSEAHPWIGIRLLVDPTRTNVAWIYEAVGSKLGPLGVPDSQQFDVASAFCNYILGNINQQSANARLAKDLATRGYDRKTYLEEMSAPWSELNETYFPFMRKIAGQFPEHDDFKQYLSGIDLILAGIINTYK